jgi:hypothetical protein
LGGPDALVLPTCSACGASSLVPRTETLGAVGADRVSSLGVFYARERGLLPGAHGTIQHPDVRPPGVSVSRAPILDRLPAATWVIPGLSGTQREDASMMRPEGRESDEFTASQREGLETRRSDQERTLAAMHGLEKALESAGPRREESWRDEVIAALAVLGEATTQEAENADRPESLLSDIAHNQPRLRNRVRGIRTQYRQLRERIGELDREFHQPKEAAPDFADLRQRLAWVLTALRHVRARESDLIYEAYYDAFRTDLEEDLGM